MVFSWVLVSFTRFYRFYWVLLGFTGFCWVLSSFSWFFIVLPSFTYVLMGYFCWNRPVLTELVIRGILLGLLKLVEFYWVFMVYYLIYGVLLKLTGFGCFLLGFYGLKWVLLGFDGLLWFFFQGFTVFKKGIQVLTNFDWVNRNLLGFTGFLWCFTEISWGRLALVAYYMALPG